MISDPKHYVYRNSQGKIVQKVIISPEQAVYERLAHPDLTIEEVENIDLVYDTVVVEEVKPRHITLLSLMTRMTRAERTSIRAAELTDEDVADIMFLFGKARYIDLDRAETIECLNALEAKTLLDLGRANEILTAPVQDSERP